MNPATARIAPVPAQATPFVGRATEAAQIKELLASDHVRLLSITGPGGIGKSRLAYEVATRSVEWFADGVGYVLLSSVTDHQLVATAIAQALDVVESAERSVFENIVEYLRHKEMLLLLDNFEHVLPAGQLLTQLLAACHDSRYWSRVEQCCTCEASAPPTSAAWTGFAGACRKIDSRPPGPRAER